MRKLIFNLLFILLTTFSFAQKHNIVNASIELKNSESSKGEEVISKLSKAKEYIDQAFNTASTADSPKMWNYRAKIYLKIALTKDQNIDNDAICDEENLLCGDLDQSDSINISDILRLVFVAITLLHP